MKQRSNTASRGSALSLDAVVQRAQQRVLADVEIVGSASSYIEDQEGENPCDLAAVSDETIEAARELMSEEARAGIAPDGSRFEIADESGNVLEIVLFRRALQHK
ncbi:hypothetical protein PY365_33915 [Roseiarcaceae bacterium H3SJ34-1]|uniref:DUF6894 family protein n=1 Tax=Terripilifer ovatus TaxID=3032367 RepID=UPI003AB9920F|nr:hypothetical protein [Roseiarcaceae bacterium H3SJ34-1]